MLFSGWIQTENQIANKIFVIYLLTTTPYRRSLSASKGNIPVTISKRETPRDQRSVGYEARSGSCHAQC